MVDNRFLQNPGIATAYQNDPRSKLANSLISTGTSTAPVSGVAEGLARAASAIAGAVVQKNQDKKYASNAEKQQATLQETAAAALAAGSQGSQAVPNPGTVSAPQGAPPSMPQGMALPPAATADLGAMPQGQGGPPGMGSAAAALAPPQAGPPPMAPGSPPGMVSNGPPPMPSGMLPQDGQQQPGFTPGGPVTASPRRQQQAQGTNYYRAGIVPIEGGTDRNGNFRTSPKGAIGPGQIMPSTGPEAARDAGVAYDENRLRTDAVYNNLLGEAHYNKLLNRFGDPLKAAAAYNSGAGRVRQALRGERNTGKPWTDFLPGETKAYVQNFAAKIDGAQGEGTPGSTIAALQADPAQQSPVGAQLENPSQPVAAPQRLQEVQSAHLAAAQSLLASGDPSLVALAQDYLGKGLTEQNDARTVGNAQQFEQGQTGYTSDLANDRAARSDVRGQRVADRTQAIQNNFASNERVAGENFQGAQQAQQLQFTGGQNDLNRSQSQRQFDAGQAGDDRRLAATIEGKRLTARETAQAKRQQFLSTAGGAKAQADAQARIDSANAAVAGALQFQELNKRSSTGAVYGRIGKGLNAIGMDDDFNTMQALGQKSVLDATGGKLGGGISDADTKLLGQATYGPNNSKETNDRIINALVPVRKRQAEYEQERLNALADGTNGNFVKDWSQYSTSVPVLKSGYGGAPQPAIHVPTYQEWLESGKKATSSFPKVPFSNSRVGRREAGITRSTPVVELGGNGYTYTNGKWFKQ